MAKRLDIAEALSTRPVNELSEKKKMIQDQVKLIEENKRRVAVMHCVPKIGKLWQLQKSLRITVSSCRDCDKAGGIWGAID